MNDDLEKLRKAMETASPQPDAKSRSENLARAMKYFDAAQEPAGRKRPTSENRSIGGQLQSGVAFMFQALSSRGGLVASTALIAAGALYFTPLGHQVFPRSTLGPNLGGQNQVSDADGTGTDGLAEMDAAPSTPEVAETATPALRKKESTQFGNAAPTDLALQAPANMASEQVGQAMSDTFSAPLPAPKRLEAPRVQQEADTEAFANEQPSTLKIVTEEPVSTFSIDVDTASYAIVRSSLNAGALPPPQAVRVEEMINYFPYEYEAPAADDAPFKPTVSVLRTPWNADTRLVHIALQGRMPVLADRPPLNLVFLIDTSGSMQDANKLPLLKQSFRLMLSQLRPDDEVAIVTYAGSAGQVLEATPASNRNKILDALQRLEAGGSTAGQQGLEQAYAVARSMTEDREVSRVILATDGDFNVGLSNPQDLKDFIADKRDEGTYLSVLGFGRGNLDDATMQALAQNGNGQAAYIDTLNEARKVLVDQLTGALFTIANDVKIQVEFNPATVAEYRLIGYETRALNREDFNNDNVDAGEIGAGHSVTAIYEVTPAGSLGVLNDPLRYQTRSATTGGDESGNELGYLRLRYKVPGETVSRLLEEPIQDQESPVSDDTRFSIAIAGFGQLLRGSAYLDNWGWEDVIDAAVDARGADEFGYRAEAINLMRLAQSLSE